MSENTERRRIIVNLDQPQVVAPVAAPREVSVPTFGQPSETSEKKRGLFGKILRVFAVLLLVATVGGAIAGYFVWRSYAASPAYSLALMADAARREDKALTEQLLDTDAVVESLVPQVVESAKERYGRGFPPAIVTRATAMVAPLLPAVKDRAKVEFPRLVRDGMQTAPKVSPWLLGIGIRRSSTIAQTGDQATVKTVLQNREIELAMQRTGERWKVVGLKDPFLADKIADAVGQRILQAANQRPNPAANARTAADLAEQIRRQIQQLEP